MGQLAQKQNIEYTLKVLSGPDKGSTYKLVSGKVTIGRDDSNDIVINGDSKCSRNHAVISFTPKGVRIFDVSGKNKISVDGSDGKMKQLKNKSVITLGNTKLQFRVHDPSEASLTPKSSNLGLPEYRSSSKKRSSRTKRGGINKLHVIFAGLAILLIFLMNQKTKKSEETNEFKTESEVSAEIINSDKETATILNERRLKGMNTIQFKKAQANYLKGFRDYQKGQYERSLESFEACLALFPNHVLCNKYYKLARRKISELIQYHLKLGKRYKEQGQYSACVSSLNNVLIMVKDPSNNLFKQAKSLRKSCLVLKGVRF